jgi:pyruvate-ferredoxin/flavodoxin oxidoreductase
MGGDGAMYDIGFQNLSRLMMSGKPIKVLVVDTQVYSNTGGQACTSGFIGQVSDMAPYGSAPMARPRRARKSASSAWRTAPPSCCKAPSRTSTSCWKVSSTA